MWLLNSTNGKFINQPYPLLMVQPVRKSGIQVLNHHPLQWPNYQTFSIKRMATYMTISLYNFVLQVDDDDDVIIKLLLSTKVSMYVYEDSDGDGSLMMMNSEGEEDNVPLQDKI